MYKIYAAFESLFGGGKTYEPTGESKSPNVTVTSYSQPHVLRERMREEKMSHGQTVKANLSPVRVEMDHGEIVMYFCPMKNIEILEVVNNGDGQGIPPQVKVEALRMPSDFIPGFYDLKNVMLTSNGTIQVIGTNETNWTFRTAESRQMV